MKWKIEPLVGVEGVRLGMTFEQVVGALGEPDQKRSSPPVTIGYWALGISVHFNPDAEFIEFARGMDTSPILLGTDVFATPADDLLRSLTATGHGFDPNTERGHTFVFRDLQIGLWRANVPEDNEDPEGRYFDSVGVGRPGYYTS